MADGIRNMYVDKLDGSGAAGAAERAAGFPARTQAV